MPHHSPEIIKVLVNEVETLRQIVNSSNTPENVKSEVAHTVGLLTLLVAIFKDTK